MICGTCTIALAPNEKHTDRDCLAHASKAIRERDARLAEYEARSSARQAKIEQLLADRQRILSELAQLIDDIRAKEREACATIAERVGDNCGCPITCCGEIAARSIRLGDIGHTHR